jgi:sterol desaturase/sphingolipid hydroxylase (fatty acid hydroxylase superfamily)
MMDVVLKNWQPFLALAGFGLFFLWETTRPFFQVTGRLRHGVRNLTVASVNAAMIVLAFSALTAWAAAWGADRGLGLLHTVEMPTWTGFIVCFLALDLWTYLWHRANHRLPLLWRFHRMHHSDEQMDVTTATRFHLGEITLSTLVRLPLVLLLGLSPATILMYDAVLLAVTQFHHANVGVGEALDRGLRYAIVTPNMHRVHHSMVRAETDSNYASILSIWDRVFRTYRERSDYRTVRYGVEGLSGDRFQTLRGMLLTPFLR